MEIEVIRRWLGPTRSIGAASVDGAHEMFTCEDRTRLHCKWCNEQVWLNTPNCSVKKTGHEWVAEPKVPKETAIPLGRYELKMEPSVKYGGKLMPRLQNVPGFVGILMHPGNDENDTEGCIVVGVTRDLVRILNSRLAFEKLLLKINAALARGEQVFVTVKLAPDAERSVC